MRAALIQMRCGMRRAEDPDQIEPILTVASATVLQSAEFALDLPHILIDGDRVAKVARGAGGGTAAAGRR